MKNKFLIATLFLIVVIGCTPALLPTQVQPIEISPSPTMLTPTVTKMLTIVVPTASLTATISPINWGTFESCVTVYPSWPDDTQLLGVAALRSLKHPMGSDVFLLNPETNTSKSLIDGYITIWEADISPNEKTLAFRGINRATEKWELVLVDATGKPQKIAWSSDDPFYFQGWANNYQVVVVQDSTYTVRDISSGIQEKFVPGDFPEFYPPTQPHFFVAFNSLVTRAVYKGGGNIILLDLKTRKILARIPDAYYDRDPVNAWQISGERAAVVGTIDTGKKYSAPSDEIFIVEHDGQTRQLTHIYETFGRRFDIHGLSWSPDGEKIAFWTGNGEKNYLLVADSATGDLKYSCITSVAWDNFGIYLPPPIWSSDGKLLMVENRYTHDDSRLLVVDFEKNIAFPIAENQFPIGWMLSDK